MRSASLPLFPAAAAKHARQPLLLRRALTPSAAAATKATIVKPEDTLPSYAAAAPPRSALALGLAGVLPFAWGAVTELSPMLQDYGAALVGSNLVGAPVLYAYGCTILSFMSGVLWGFSTRANGPIRAAAGYAVSTVPALYVFFAVQAATTGADAALLSHAAMDEALLRLAGGYGGLLLLDGVFAVQGLAPAWWMRMRALLTTLVVVCLGVGAACAPDGMVKSW